MRTIYLLTALALTHVTIVDVTGGPSRPDMTIVVAGDRIIQIGPSAALSPPPGSTIVDGAGTYVIPGLWDMHVHSVFDPYQRAVVFPLDIAWGVTGVRDMAADCFNACADADSAYNPLHGPTAAMVQRWKREISVGTLMGPRIVAASDMLDGPQPIWPGAVAIHDTAEARAAVRLALSRGADFIKVYSGLSRDAYLAIADEAKRRGIPFAGHVPEAVALDEAADVGQLSMEHLLKMPEACSTNTAKLDPAMGIRSIVTRLNESFSLTACAPLLARFKRDHTWQVPTLVAERGQYLMLDTGVTQDPRRSFMAAVDTAWWQDILRQRQKRFTQEDLGLARTYFQHHLDMVGAMYRAGVGVLAGTDVSNPWIYWGSSLHDELALFVQAGMTPLAALQSATIQPARFFHATDTLGTVAPGRVADLVVLEADPLADIANTRRIRAVVVRGRLVDSAARQQLLDSVLAYQRRNK